LRIAPAGKRSEWARMAPPAAATGLSGTDIGTVGVSPQHPPGLYGPESGRRALNLASGMPALHAMADVPGAPVAVSVAPGAREPGVLLSYSPLLHVLLALVTVVAMARVAGTLFGMIRQPPVIGEIVAGIMLGPSLLGRLAPSLSAYLFPASVAPALNVISQVAVILFMFLVGL